MPVKAYVVSTPAEGLTEVKLAGRKSLATLGPSEETVAVQLKELFTAIAGSVSASLEVESQLTVEISGSISLKAEGSAKYLFFNLGGEASAAANMKVVLATTLKPKIDVGRKK